MQSRPAINPAKTENIPFVKRIYFYLLVAAGLSFVSVLLNTIAIGPRMEMRAFNHINLLLFLFIAFSLFEISKKYDLKRIFTYLFPISLMLIIVINLYNIFSNYPELKKYNKSFNKRLEYLETLKREENKNMIQLKELDAAYYHSVDEIWRIVIPNFTRSFLIKPNEVSRDLSNQYNINYKKYYNLDFEVYTTLDYSLGITKSEK